MSITLSQTTYKSRNAFVAGTLDVGRHFGFSYLPALLKEGQKHTVQASGITTLFPHEDAVRSTAQRIAERYTFARQSHRLGYDVHTIKTGSGKNARKETCLSFHITGTKKPIAEATVITLAVTALKEAGIPDTLVHINALGNHESNQRYNKELSTYLKKHLPPTQAILDEIHEHPRRVLARLIRECAPCVENAPTPLEFLNDDAREHVKKLLEYLEATHIPYVLDPTVVGSSDVWEYILFDIRDAHEQSGAIEHVCVQPRILAVGGRYSPCVRKAFKQAVDSVGVLLTIDGLAEVSKKELETPLPHTPFFFGHVSETAKKISLNVITLLREARIAVRHAITRDTLTHQLSHFPDVLDEKKGAEYMIMIGHKEAIDGTAIVRNERTRAQKEVPITELAAYLKRVTYRK